MKKRMTDVIVFVLPFCILFAAYIEAIAQDVDKTEAPYFFIQSDDPALDQLPLKSTRAEVTISGVIADVTIRQIYQNTGERPLEAIYIFPASTRAAVYKLRMTIGTRIIEAKVEERDKARQEYEQAKQDGYSASLLEQQRPNVFQMNIANIMPGDTIQVELKYTEILIPEEKEYVFVYPTVVGPRYAREDNTESWVENPYLKEGGQANYTFDIRVAVSGGMPIQQMVCTSHRTRIDYISENQANVQLDPNESNGGDRDFILRYRLSGDRIENGLLLYQGKTENFFLLMVQPPERIKPEEIPAREYIFIVDVSGSMHGFPLEISKSVIRDLVRNLKKQDYFNILLFAGGSSLLAHQSLPATEENIMKALDVIDRQRGGGGTELLPALKQALDLPRPGKISRTVVIATDGYVNVEKEAFDLIRGNLSNANMFAFGIGSSVNRYLIEGLARAGQGEPFVVTEYAEAKLMADRFRKYIQTPVLTNVRYEFDHFDAYDIEPVSVPDVFAERPVVLFGKWKGNAQGSVTVTGRQAGNRIYRNKTEIEHFEPRANHQALRYLWARNRIALLSDYLGVDQDEEFKREVTSLGLTYNLLTEFTSFLAIDSERRNDSQNVTTVKQPLPLPHGVSRYALGSGARAAGGLVKSASHQTLGVLDASESEIAAPIETPELELGPIIVNPGADSLAVRYFLQKHLEDLSKCLKNNLSPTQRGKIMILLVIETDGSISQTRIIHHTLSNSNFSKCLVGVFYGNKISGNWPAQTSRVTCELILN